MRVVFFGTNEFSVKALQGVIDSKNEVVGVVSQPDKINGRNNKIIKSKIKEFCEQNNITLFQFQKLNIEGEQVLKSLEPDLFVTASYGQIIRKNILDIPKYGTVNVHASLLPKYRGAAPIQWAIMNGEEKTGITIMKTDIGVDTGDIFFERECKIEETDTASSLFEKLGNLGRESIKYFLENFDELKDKTTKQNDELSCYSPMLKKEDSKIDFSKSAKEVVNFIKGRDCGPVAFFKYNNLTVKVFMATDLKTNSDAECGEIISANSKEGLIIKVADGLISLDVLQLEGKKMMPAKSFLNGFKMQGKLE